MWSQIPIYSKMVDAPSGWLNCKNAKEKPEDQNQLWNIFGAKDPKIPKNANRLLFKVNSQIEFDKNSFY